MYVLNVRTRCSQTCLKSQLFNKIWTLLITQNYVSKNLELICKIITDTFYLTNLKNTCMPIYPYYSFL